MKLTDLIQTGVSNRSQRVVIYGSNGIGKSTLAAGFPGPIFVDTEDGTSHLDVRRIPVNNYYTLCKALEELPKCELPCETIVIDTIDRVELFLRETVCKEHRISGMEGLAYGKAYQFLDLATGDSALVIDHLKEGGLALANDAISRKWPAIGHGVADLEFRGGDARCIRGHGSCRERK